MRAAPIAWLVAVACFGCGDDGDPVDLGPERADLGEPEDAAARDASLPVDAGRPDGGATDLGLNDLGATDAGPRTLVSVAHRRELRAMWVATVFRLDFPSSTTLTPAESRSELEAIADRVRSLGMNAIYFQVRPESDAAYSSAIEPWSRFLSGNQGSNPGYDPLDQLIEVAHQRGLEAHAWANPFRGLTSATSTPDPLHPVNRFPDAAEPYGDGVTMNPADPAVRAHVRDVLVDIVSRYDVDGVVFDDYFYPYPSSEPFPDDADYSAYLASGGTLAKNDWRRENVNALIASIDPALAAVAPWVRWGVAPFGIYRPGMPAEVTGLDAYEVLAADSKRWVDEGWVDYIAPQLYWTSTSTGQPFGPLVDWWAGVASPERPVVPSLALYRHLESPEWTANELATQVALTRAAGPSAAGQTWFRYGSLDSELETMLRGVYAEPARPPAVPGYDAVVEPPAPYAVPGGVAFAHAEPAAIRGYAVYRQDGADWALQAWAPMGATALALAPGTYAVSVIDRGGLESEGVEVVVR